jgi:hypothetical protein
MLLVVGEDYLVLKRESRPHKTQQPGKRDERQ